MFVIFCSILLYCTGLAFIVKAVCRGLKSAKEATTEPTTEVQKVIDYLDAVDSVKHSSDGVEVAIKYEELGLHREQIPMPLLSSKEVRLFVVL